VDGWCVDRIVSEEVQSREAADKKRPKQSCERERMDREIDPNRAVDFIRDNGKVYAKAKADRVYMEEYRKSLKAILMKRSLETAVNAQEREAYSHDEYVALLEGLREAVETEERLRWEMVAAQARVEVWRSQEASNRAMDRVTI
jgi:hypothetical protein